MRGTIAPAHIDLLIDLMTNISAMNKATTRQDTLRYIHECEESLKAIQFRLQNIKQRTMADTPEDIQFP
jgi:hypothetical protein